MIERSVEKHLPVEVIPKDERAECLDQQCQLENQKLTAEIHHLRKRVEKLDMEIRVAKKKVWLEFLTVLMSGSGLLLRLLALLRGCWP